MIAIEKNHYEIAQLLLNNGAKIDSSLLCNYYLLFQNACVKRRVEIVKILLDNKIQLCSTYKDLVRRNSKFGIIIILVVFLKINYLNFLAEESYLNDWKAVLQKIWDNGDLNIIKMIVNYEEPGCRQLLFNSCLTAAVNSGNHSAICIIEYLLYCGADVNTAISEKGSIISSCSLKMAKILVKHIVYLQDFDEFVVDDHLAAINRDETLISFQESCRCEIDSMKEQMFANASVSLYNVCKSKDREQLIGYLKNENIKAFLLSKEFIKNFPIYYDSMKIKFKIGFKRIYLEKRVCNFFNSLSARDQLPQIPVACVKRIFKYLNNKDLDNLRNAYYTKKCGISTLLCCNTL